MSTRPNTYFIDNRTSKGSAGNIHMYSIPFDKSQITFELPSGLRGTVIESRRVPPLADVAAGGRRSRWH
jgi:hypothetical protein